MNPSLYYLKSINRLCLEFRTHFKWSSKTGVEGKFHSFSFRLKIQKQKAVGKVPAVQLETSTSHQPLPFKVTPTVTVSRHFLTDRLKMFCFFFFFLQTSFTFVIFCFPSFHLIVNVLWRHSSSVWSPFWSSAPGLWRQSARGLWHWKNPA